jgi:exodeoxyribonuclease-5
MTREEWIKLFKDSTSFEFNTDVDFSHEAARKLEYYESLISEHQVVYNRLKSALDEIQRADIEYVLTAGQQEAITKIEKWFKGSDRYFRLTGYAGTGKSYVISLLSDKLDSHEVLFTAPTNKATKVLKSLMPNRVCKTIYSALSLKMVEREDERVLMPADERFNLSGYKYIFVDEASMLNSELMGYIDTSAIQYGIKLLFICDFAQLPPVGEDESPVFNLNCPNHELTEVVRHDNQILEVATHVRTCIVNNIKLKPIELSDGPKSVYRLSKYGFIERIQRAAASGFQDVKIVAWRNSTVDELNDIVRNTIYTREQLDSGFWLPKDNVVVTAPINLDRKLVATTDDEGVVTEVSIGVDFDTGLKCYHPTLRMEDGSILRLRVLHESAFDEFQETLSNYANEARMPGNGKLWGRFWKLKDRFHHIRHSYAITAHRAQGSTFKYVFVDASDILSNPDRHTAYRCLYVAVSRASDRLYVCGLHK